MSAVQSFPEFIPVTIDKSHITTIGERLYAESIEFVRELVNNAYDADATLVEIIIAEDSIEIRDNGSGMDMEGLKQYFNIGSQQKLYSRNRQYITGTGSVNSVSASLQVFQRVGDLRLLQKRMNLLEGLFLIKSNGKRPLMHGNCLLRDFLPISGNKTAQRLY
jgi:hypothetical protein